MKQEEKTPSTIDEYISGFPEDVIEIMNEVRNLIRKVAPDVQEKISWGMPTLFIGKNRMHFAANKNHLGLYPGVKPIELYKEELASYHTSKGAIQLPYSQPLPVKLIAKIAKAALMPE